MAIEQAVYDAITAAITNYAGYTTVWNKTIFYVEDFDLDIPSGTKHKGQCPFVAFRGGTTDDFTQEVGDLFSGTVEFEMCLYLSMPLASKKAAWDKMHVFTAEIERAVDNIDAAGFKMKAQTSKDNPESRKGMITRVLTVSVDASECRGAAGPPTFTVDPVISGDAQVGNTLTATTGTATGSSPITYTGQWYLDAAPITGETGLTYLIVAGDLGSDITYISTATNGILPDDTATSNMLEVVASPIFTSNPTISGTPEPGETITAVDGTATGDPTPTITGEWYLDAVATGETGLTYIVQSGDVGKDLTYLNTATNTAGVDTAASNSLSIISAFIGPLDILPNALISHSIPRAMISTYTGNLIKVRRDSDNAEQDIGLDGDLLLDETALETFLGDANGFITTLYDNDGTFNSVQTSAASQTPIQSGLITGVYAGNHSGSQFYAVNNGVSKANSDMFAYAVIDPQGSSKAFDSILELNSAGRIRLYDAAANPYTGYDDNTTTVSINVRSNGLQVLSWHAVGGTLTMYRNQVSIGSGAWSGPMPGTGAFHSMMVGCFDYFAEFNIWDLTATNQNRIDVVQNAMDFYGIT